MGWKVLLFMLLNNFLGIPAMLVFCNRQFLKVGEYKGSACWAVVVHIWFTFVTLTSLALLVVVTRCHPLFLLLQSITQWISSVSSCVFISIICNYSVPTQFLKMFVCGFSFDLCCVCCFICILKFWAWVDLWLHECVCCRYESSLFGLELMQMAVRL